MIGSLAGGCGCSGMPKTVSEDAIATFLIRRTRDASRMLYVWRMFVWKTTWLAWVQRDLGPHSIEVYVEVIRVGRGRVSRPEVTGRLHRARRTVRAGAAIAARWITASMPLYPESTSPRSPMTWP